MELIAGTINQEFGIYKNDCCGDELILYKGVEFPNCRKHQGLSTRWQKIGTIFTGPLNRRAPSGESDDGSPAA